MIGQTPHQNSLSAQHELTPRDDAKKIVSEILKRVDQLIKKNNLELAMSEIKSAKEIDPRNVYTLALEERVNVLLLAEQKRNAAQHPDVVTTPLPEPVVIQESIPVPAPVSAEPLQEPESIPHLSAAPVPPRHAIIDLEEYKKIMMDAWSHGSISPEKEAYVRKVRELTNISDEENIKIEKEVKRECYKRALMHIQANPALLNNNMNLLVELRRVYQITDEEHIRIQTELSANVRQRKQREKLLVIDDDVRLLELLSASLEGGGFDVTALSTSDEAYALLRKLTPDLILCDINLETSTMGGFTFYERVQELKHLQKIPFIFLTGLTDETLVRTGKELGVDDYLVKPISEQTLLSTLRGKLKRFRQLRKTSEPSAASLATV